MKARRFVAWGLITLVLMAGSSAATWWVATSKTRLEASRIPVSMLNSTQFQRFVSTYQLIRSKSIWHNTPNQLLLGATNGMVGTLHDQFTNYLTGGQTQNLESLLAPSYVGIGIEVTLKKPLTIQSVFPGTPAAKAGLRAGEAITAVNGHNTASMSPNAAMQLIHGKVGTRVDLTIREGSQTRHVTLTRARIPYPTVYSEMLPGGLAYMNIVEFGQDTGTEAVQQFHQLMRQHPKGIVLDLRDNPGGEITAALQVANLFVPKGPVVTLKYKNAKKDATYDSLGPGTRLPVVVLVNGGTASAAEILSAAIQERQGGLLVGTRTYGKGIVQQVIPLSDGASLKLTVARYYTPNGDYIEHKGLIPNIQVVEPTNVQPSDIPAQDPQLRAAIAALENMIKKGVYGK
ncbi:MAG: S41 family peptidase [Firmicutes bacterium]|nr:S41 family peptidase [Bacillota bacterium]